MSLLSGLFRKKYPLQLGGFTDWHCHILPGVDDGVETMAESLDILKGYEQAGIKEVWFTPHIMEDVPNTTSALRQRFMELTEAYKGPVKLHLAAENMIDNLFRERLEANDFLPIGDDGKTLLVETSYFNAPIKFRETIRAIKSKGYFPLLAHPERYNYMHSLSEYKALKEHGVLFQLNLLSLGGHYGPGVQKKAMQLLADGLYDRCGTDLHRAGQLDSLLGLRLRGAENRMVQGILF